MPQQIWARGTLTPLARVRLLAERWPGSSWRRGGSALLPALHGDLWLGSSPAGQEGLSLSALHTRFQTAIPAHFPFQGRRPPSWKHEVQCSFLKHELRCGGQRRTGCPPRLTVSWRRGPCLLAIVICVLGPERTGVLQKPGQGHQPRPRGHGRSHFVNLGCGKG